jgi:putative glycerol-1-phosphate prenyltransferase
VPTVLNSRDTKWITGLHQEAVKEYGYVMNWEDFIVEGYCILNNDCKAAQVTNANTDLSKEDVASYALMAEKMFHLPIFYVEYSGTYGDPELVAKVKNVLEQTTLFYGGGITSQEQAKEMAALADVVVVGNIIYDDIKEALLTVKAVKESIEK